jgi:DNA-directed RNA polymerase subunit RPC12/RpoP
LNKCPGQDARNVTATTYPCPKCGASVEIFSDEQRRRCPKCKTMVFTQEAPTCAKWCKAAQECLGQERYYRMMEQQKASGEKPQK